MGRKAFVLAATHLLALVAGVALGVYFLPIIAAPPVGRQGAGRSKRQGSLDGGGCGA